MYIDEEEYARRENEFRKRADKALREVINTYRRVLLAARASGDEAFLNEVQAKTNLAARERLEKLSDELEVPFNFDGFAFNSFLDFNLEIEFGRYTPPQA